MIIIQVVAPISLSYHLHQKGRGPAKRVQEKYTIAPKIADPKNELHKMQTVVIKIYYDPLKPHKPLEGYLRKPRRVLSKEELKKAFLDIKNYCWTHGNLVPTYNDGMYFVRINDDQGVWKQFQAKIGRCDLIGERMPEKADVPPAMPEPEE